MGIKTIQELVDAELAGKTRDYIFRKVPSQVTTTSVWFDMSMSPGMPVPKYWFDATPLTAKAITQSLDGGLFHGPNVFPDSKFCRRITVQCSSGTGLPMTAFLCDYLLYYPTIDDGITDPQVMDNTVSLPRYATDKSLQMIAVTTGARTGGQQFYVTYTNQDGVTGRTSKTMTQNTSAALGSIVNTSNISDNGASPFIPLQEGDTGITAVESVTMLGPDVGLFSIIIVKPLESIQWVNAILPYEKNLLEHHNRFFQIKDDAFLNFIVLPQGSISGITYTGSLKIFWN